MALELREVNDRIGLDGLGRHGQRVKHAAVGVDRFDRPLERDHRHAESGQLVEDAENPKIADQ